MTTKDEAVQKAIDTLAELCDVTEADERDIHFSRRQSATSILDHYRETEFAETLKHIAIDLTVNGAFPVRPMTRAEVTE